jgi:hypothetical protein
MLEGCQQPSDNLRQIELFPKGELSVTRRIIIFRLMLHFCCVAGSVNKIHFFERSQYDVEDAERQQHLPAKIH